MSGREAASAIWLLSGQSVFGWHKFDVGCTLLSVLVARTKSQLIIRKPVHEKLETLKAQPLPGFLQELLPLGDLLMDFFIRLDEGLQVQAEAVQGVAVRLDRST